MAETKLPRLKFQKGNIGIQMNEIERRLLIECTESNWQAEADLIGVEPGAEKRAFILERFRHRLYGYKIDRTKYDRQNQPRTECPKCGREFLYIETHKCKGAPYRPDPDILARI